VWYRLGAAGGDATAAARSDTLGRRLSPALRERAEQRLATWTMANNQSVQLEGDTRGE
jgi:hypothetical protein